MRVGSYLLGSQGDSAGKEVDLNTAASMLLKTLSTLQATPMVALISSTGIPERAIAEALELLKEGGLVEVLPDGVKLTASGDKARYLVAS